MKQLITVVGEVTVSKVVKSKKYRLGRYHNTITKTLANGLVGFIGELFLTGSISQSSYIPSFIGIGIGSNGSSDDFNRTSLVEEYKNSSGEPIRYAITSKELNLGDNSVSSISLRAFIAPGDLNPKDEIKEVGLFTGPTGNNMLSRVELTDAIVKEDGSGIDILWNIMIGPGEDGVSIV